MDLDFKFGISLVTPKEFEPNELHEKRVKKLLKNPGSAEIVSVCRHYINKFVPSPVETEDERWMMSVYPSSACAVRLNIYWHEVMNITEYEPEIENTVGNEMMVFCDKEYLTESAKTELLNNIPGFRIDPEYYYSSGLESQLAVMFPIEYYFKVIENVNLHEAIKQYNYKLANKGKKVHKGHNYGFTRMLFNTQS